MSKKRPSQSKAFSNPAVFADVNDLLGIKRKVQGMMLPATRKAALSGSGNTRSPFRTRGLDFQEVRAYQPGDDVRQIDWRVTAKYGKPFTKLYTDEKERDVFFICDMRPTMKFASHGQFKSVVVARVATFLSFLALKKNDRVGFMILGPNGLEIVPPEMGENVVVSFVRALSKASDPTDIQGADITLTHALKKAGDHVKRGGIVFVLSDFADLNGAAVKHFAGLSDKKTVSLIHIYDAIEAEMPAGVFPVSNGERVLFLDTKVHQKQYRLSFEKLEKTVTDAVQKYQLGYVPLGTDEPDLEQVAAYVQGGFQ